MRETADDRRESEAVTNARHRVGQVADSHGINHPEYATGLNQLALLLIMQGDPDASEPLLREALEIRRAALGERHPDFATNLSSLGGLLWARGDLDQAEPLLRQAVDVRRATLGPVHPKTVVSLNSLEQLIKLRRESAPTLAPVSVPTRVEPPTVPTVPPAPIVEPAAAPVVEPTIPTLIAPASPPQEPANTRSEVVAPVPEIQPRVEESPVSPPPVAVSVSQALGDRLGGLEREFKALGDRLSRAGVGLLKDGRPPAADVLSTWSSTRETFDTFKADLRSTAEAMNLSVPSEGFDNLRAAAAFLPEMQAAEDVRSREKASRIEALNVLRRIERLRSPGDPDFAALAACRAQSQSLGRSIEDAAAGAFADEVQRLNGGSHPLALLLKLVENDADTNDAQWADWYDAVASSLGNPLAIAAARSRIVEGDG